MKNTIIAAVSAVALGACWGAPPQEKILADLCQEVFVGDIEIVPEFADEFGADIPTFCACYAATIMSQPDKVDLHRDVSLAIAEARNGTARGTEEAAEHVEELIRNGEIDTFTEDQLMDVGSDYQRIGRSLSRNDGVCPVSS
ncbi:MAG: hypothetical protein NXH72_00120 [Hyphomonadaceae bacterium]|nr:hypothetical protein [Hyphomonadaceae bacterium]